MSCLLSYYNTLPFPLQSNLRAVFCTFYIPHLFQLLQNPGCSCAVFRFSIPKCKISTLDCAGFGFFLLKCTISTSNCAGSGFFLLKCTISTSDCAGFDFFLLKCTISTPDCAGFDFSLLKCTISTPDCAGFGFFLLKCTISTSDCAGSSLFLLKCTISTPDCAESSLFLLKCKIRSQNCAKQRISLDISSRQSAALSAAIFLRHTRLILAKCFCFTKEACSLKQKEKRRSLSYSKTYSAVFSLDCNCSGRGILLSGKVEQEVSEIPPM